MQFAGKRSSSPGIQPVVVILSWLDELKRMVKP